MLRVRMRERRGRRRKMRRGVMSIRDSIVLRFINTLAHHINNNRFEPARNFRKESHGLRSFHSLYSHNICTTSAVNVTLATRILFGQSFSSHTFQSKRFDEVTLRKYQRRLPYPVMEHGSEHRSQAGLSYSASSQLTSFTPCCTCFRCLLAHPVKSIPWV